MNIEKRIVVCALEIVLGAALLVGSRLFSLDSTWLGIGAALIAVGAVQLLGCLRYKKDETYREKVDVDTHDERQAFIRRETWVWAGAAFVIAEGLLTVLLLILGKNELSTVTGGAVCLLTLLYWIFHLILKRKY